VAVVVVVGMLVVVVEVVRKREAELCRWDEDEEDGLKENDLESIAL
jgi:hypothetical protein